MQLFPGYNFDYVWVVPWNEELVTTIQILLMALFVCSSCALIGNYLLLRRMSLVGDAISHSVLPGLVIAFLIAGKLSPFWLLVGAGGSGIATTFLIEFINEKSRVKTDAAIGIAFCSLFALGVVLIHLFAGKVHLDADCVLFGQLENIVMEIPTSFLGLVELPSSIIRMGIILIVLIVLIGVFFKELLLTSFDQSLASSLGFYPKLFHYGMMAVLAILVVGSFEAVGAILVVAMLVLPSASAYLLTRRLKWMHFLSVFHAILSTLLGFHLARWIDCPIAACIVVASTFLFVMCWGYYVLDKLIGKQRASLAV